MELKTFSLDLGLFSDSIWVSVMCVWVYSVCACECVCAFALPVSMCSYDWKCVCIYIFLCVFTSLHVHAYVCVFELSTIILRRLMINLCLTCLFTELLGGPWGVCAARNAANNSSNEKMQMIRLDPAPNP